MPPIIGVAMRFITSDPLCVAGDYRMGTSPKRIAQTVMILGRSRLQLIPAGGVPLLDRVQGLVLLGGQFEFTMDPLVRRVRALPRSRCRTVRQ